MEDSQDGADNQAGEDNQVEADIRVEEDIRAEEDSQAEADMQPEEDTLACLLPQLKNETTTTFLQLSSLTITWSSPPLARGTQVSMYPP